ncbi:hypothetical protein [Litchfieldia salsa]|uniref:Uncharacterized protein n=1 Tax=Litchfieldia salsa TaxID=930152 RepID=A0A1H0X138_9BACI|nr:hypothetical protein [Litchfieldia salsa]SDP96622.1 hypothetical protein SAMN05216565_12215 [Litchfieldia salsa]
MYYSNINYSTQFDPLINTWYYFPNVEPIHPSYIQFLRPIIIIPGEYSPSTTFVPSI